MVVVVMEFCIGCIVLLRVTSLASLASLTNGLQCVLAYDLSGIPSIPYNRVLASFELLATRVSMDMLPPLESQAQPCRASPASRASRASLAD